PLLAASMARMLAWVLRRGIGVNPPPCSMKAGTALWQTRRRRPAQRADPLRQWLTIPEQRSAQRASVDFSHTA
ncbi:MAG: hypothetical protein MK041_00655, partial [Aquabacterium sp.]|nr:hypothetical protein [Aquabacterium sp.]